MGKKEFSISSSLDEKPSDPLKKYFTQSVPDQMTGNEKYGRPVVSSADRKKYRLIFYYSENEKDEILRIIGSAGEFKTYFKRKLREDGADI